MSRWYNGPLWSFLGFLLLAAWFWLQNGWEPLLLLLSAAAVHELGHAAVLRAFDAPATAFRLSPFGAAMRTDSAGLSYPKELAAVLAGPAANLLCGGLLAILARKSLLPYSPAGAHFVLGIFNLLPVRPLDGGRALDLLLSWLLGPNLAERVSAVVGTAAAALLAFFFLWLMKASGGNLWLLPAAAGMAAACFQNQKRGKPVKNRRKNNRFIRKRTCN